MTSFRAVLERGSSYPRVTRRGRKIDHTHLSRSEVTSVSLLPLYPRGVDRDNFTFM